MEEATTIVADKVTILPGGTVSAATYCIQEEDHTLGNILRWMIMKNPAVEFCGYSAPHPSEAKIHIRIQMYDDKPALDALREALDNLEDLVLAIEEKYDDALAGGDYEKKEDLSYDFESVNNRLWEQKEREGRGTRAEWEAAKKEREDQEEKEKEKERKGKSKTSKAMKAAAGR